MPTTPRSPARPQHDEARGPVAPDELQSEHTRQRAALAQLEAELTDLQADPQVLQEDRDATRLLVERSREALAASEQALTRVAEGTYGRCLVCEQPIPPERLEAVPDATTCVACSTTR